MTAKEYNKKEHKYIWNVSHNANNIIHISGIIGGRIYMMYTLRQAIQKYNTEARKTLRGEL